VLVKAKVDNNKIIIVAVTTHDITLNMVNIEKAKKMSMDCLLQPLVAILLCYKNGIGFK
jgi:hypothetical protein